MLGILETASSPNPPVAGDFFGANRERGPGQFFPPFWTNSDYRDDVAALGPEPRVAFLPSPAEVHWIRPLRGFVEFFGGHAPTTVSRAEASAEPAANPVIRPVDLLLPRSER